MLKQLIILALLSLPVAAQDCIVTFSFKNGSTASVPFNNKTKQCQNWILGFSTNSGFSVVSVQLESAPDIGGIPGTFVAYAGTITTGSNPLTGINTNVATFKNGTACCDWIRVNPVTLTNSGSLIGTVTGSLFGFRVGQSNFAAIGSSNYGSMFANFVTPNNANFAWQNQGSATATVNANGSITLFAGTGAGGVERMMRCDTVSSLAPPYTFTMAFIPSFLFNDTTGMYMGAAVSDGTKLQAMAYGGLSTAYRLDNCLTPATTLAGCTNINTPQFALGASVVWMRFVNNSTTRQFSFSTDGINWSSIPFYSQAVGTFLTETQPCFYLTKNNGNYVAAITLVSWQVSHP